MAVDDKNKLNFKKNTSTRDKQVNEERKLLKKIKMWKIRFIGKIMKNNNYITNVLEHKVVRRREERSTQEEISVSYTEEGAICKLPQNKLNGVRQGNGCIDKAQT